MLRISCIPTTFNRAMLKMTLKSFCRYARLINENINYNNFFLKYFHLSCGRKTTNRNNPNSHPKKRFRLKTAVLPRTKLVLNKMECARAGSFEESSDEYIDESFPRQSQIPPDFRRWESRNNKTKGETFTVVSYNVLAQSLLERHRYLYKRCHPNDLKWKVRFERIFKEIMDLDPDILCLQEVQVDHIKPFYNKFEENGYLGKYKQKKGMVGRNDGCAIYYKSDKFKLEDYQTVEYYQPDIPLLNYSNVGMIMKLKPLACPAVPIIVATTHLLYNIRKDGVRLAQMQIMLAELDRFAYIKQRKTGEKHWYHPIILTGDFNSPPDRSVIELLVNGSVKVAREQVVDYNGVPIDWRRLAVTDHCQHLFVHLNRHLNNPSNYSAVRIFNSDMDDEAETRSKKSRWSDGLEPEVMKNKNLFRYNSITQPFRFCSVCTDLSCDNYTTTATTFQDAWTTVDYIFLSTNGRVRPVERLRLPTTEECKVLGALPNNVYGSDHLVLAARFEIADQSGNQPSTGGTVDTTKGDSRSTGGSPAHASNALTAGCSDNTINRDANISGRSSANGNNTDCT